MNVTQLSPADISRLRQEGVDVIAAAVGRVPGVVYPILGGIETVYALVGAYEPQQRWCRLLSAVAWVESKGDDLAVSPTGALGPLQLTVSIYGDDSGYPAINPFRWEEALARAKVVIHGYWARASRGEGIDGLQPLLMALAAYKEGWRGALRPETRERGLAYAWKVVGFHEALGGKL